MKKMNIVILAAGLGKRMRSALPKVLQQVGGKPMLGHVVETAREVSPDGNIVVVTGHGSDEVKGYLSGSHVSFAFQAEQKGTGHAVQQAVKLIDISQPTLILYGDVPLIKPATLTKLIGIAKGGFGLLTIDLDNPKGYGRIVRRDGKVSCIVEEKDASAEQREIHEVNTGVMVLPSEDMIRWLSGLSCNNQQCEYYLTDLVAMAVSEGKEVRTFKAQDPWEVEGANDRLQLEALERAFQRRQAEELLLAGVSLADKNRIDIRGTVRSGKDVFIDVGCVFEGEIELGDGVRVGPYSILKNTKISAGTEIQAFSHFEDAEVGEGVRIGPFARLRPGTVLHDDVHIGNFVEIKKSEIGNGSKVNHLSYIGDTTMGSGVNIGAGTITCNYDGANKFRTVIEDDCFIGSDTQLIAPVTVSKGATVGAGTTVTKDVSAGSLVISRVRQTEKSGWKRPTKKKE